MLQFRGVVKKLRISLSAWFVSTALLASCDARSVVEGFRGHRENLARLPSSRLSETVPLIAKCNAKSFHLANTLTSSLDGFDFKDYASDPAVLESEIEKKKTEILVLSMLGFGLCSGGRFRLCKQVVDAERCLECLNRLQRLDSEVNMQELQAMLEKNGLPDVALANDVRMTAFSDAMQKILAEPALGEDAFQELANVFPPEDLVFEPAASSPRSPTKKTGSKGNFSTMRFIGGLKRRPPPAKADAKRIKRDSDEFQPAPITKELLEKDAGFHLEVLWRLFLSRITNWGMAGLVKKHAEKDEEEKTKRKLQLITSFMTGLGLLRMAGRGGSFDLLNPAEPQHQEVVLTSLGDVLHLGDKERKKAKDCPPGRVENKEFTVERFQEARAVAGGIFVEFVVKEEVSSTEGQDHSADGK